MKKTKLLLALFSLSALIFTSCGQGGNSTPGQSSVPPEESQHGDVSSNGGSQSSQQGGNDSSQQGGDSSQQGGDSSPSGGNSSVDVSTPTSITLDTYEMTLTAGGSGAIKATVYPVEGNF